ncbi:phosphatase PAP2 family protein [Pyrodictium delaneyi]|uniref:phosphatase PAP2 family protein n=1 Tax=Pyrodictium delaneyi TaxID=1273541 RepID=UPI001C5B3490|nr:phosphatase PAP2 family protein [Pyrodictium delaneyi]
MTVLELMGLTDNLNYLIFHSIPPQGSVFVRLLSLTASVAAFIVYAAILVVYDIAKFGKLRLQTVALGISLASSMIVVAVLKALLQVPRPGEQPLHYPFLQALLVSDYYAFPSGHTARAVVAAYYIGKRQKPYFRAALWIWAFSVAASRVLLGAHWVSDVIASTAIGLATALIVDCTARYWVRVYNKFLGRIKVLRLSLD